MKSTILTTQRPSLALLDEIEISNREHRAYNECYQFEGDHCSECEGSAADYDAVAQALADTKDYNLRYTDYVRRRAAMYASNKSTRGIGEDDLRAANAYARGDVEDCAPPDGYVQIKVANGDGECGRCGGDSMVGSFPHVYGGQCFECGITAAQAAARARRKAKTEEERTDARGVLDVVDPEEEYESGRWITDGSADQGDGYGTNPFAE